MRRRMFDLEIKILFLNYNKDKYYIKKELETETDEKTKVTLKKKIKNLDNLQLELIQQYLEEAGPDLPLEMQCYFTGEILIQIKTIYFMIGEMLTI